MNQGFTDKLKGLSIRTKRNNNILDFEKAYANQVKNNDEMEFEYYH